MFIVAVLLFRAPAAALAQEPTGWIVGVVSQASSDTAHPHNEPIPGATVMLLETPSTTISNDQGEFALGPLPPRVYVLEARRIGYRPVHEQVRVTAGQRTKIDLHLTAVPITVDAVVIEALQDQSHRTYDLSELQKVPLVGTANVTAVTLRQIKQIHARDPWELVRQSTGLEVHEQGQGPGFASDAVIRGFTSDHSADVALVVDGVPINEPVNGHGEGYADWNLIFPGALADVQVIKGPISPLFGNFASGGAVNVTTQASAQQTSFQLEGGSHTFGAATLTTGFEKGAWGGFLGGHGVHSDGWRDNSGYGTAQVIGRINRRMTPEFLLDAGLQYYGTNWDSPGYLSLAQFNAGDLTSAADPTDGGNKQRFQGRASAVLIKPTLQWNSTVWGYDSHWHLFLTIPELGGAGEGTGSQTEELDDRRAFGGKSIAKWTRGSLELTAGAEVQRHQAAYDIWSTIARRRDITINRLDATQVTLAGLGGAAKTFGRLLRLEAALRADRLQPKTLDRVTRLYLPATSHTVLSPKFGAVLYARGNLQFYGSAARGFRSAPATIGEPTRAPVTVWAFEGGARFSTKRVDGSAAFFRLDTQNELVFNPVTLETEDTGHSIREGIEWEVKLHPVPQFEFETHFTWNTKGLFFVADTTAQPAASIDPLFSMTDASSTTVIMHDEGAGRFVEGVADYSGRVGVTVRPTLATWINTWATVMGPYVPLGEPDAKTTAYVIGNIQTGARLTDRIELAFGVDNVLNKRAAELRASGAVNPVAPRTVHLNVNTRW